MRQRFSGITKKGRNLFHCFRYARIILKTWWWRSGLPWASRPGPSQEAAWPPPVGPAAEEPLERQV